MERLRKWFLPVGHLPSCTHLSFRPGTSDNTLSSLPRCPRYNRVMRYKLILVGALFLFRVSGCDKHPLTDYRPLDQAGMWSSDVEQLKKLNTADLEVAQFEKLNQAGINDDAYGTFISGSDHRMHSFTTVNSAIILTTWC